MLLWTLAGCGLNSEAWQDFNRCTVRTHGWHDRFSYKRRRIHVIIGVALKLDADIQLSASIHWEGFHYTPNKAPQTSPILIFWHHQTAYAFPSINISQLSGVFAHVSVQLLIHFIIRSEGHCQYHGSFHLRLLYEVE